MLETMSASLMVVLTHQEKSSLPHLYFITFSLDLIRNKYSVLGRYLMAYLTSRNVPDTSWNEEDSER